MEDNKAALPQLDTIDDIKEKIYTIRGVQVMLDSDLARIYGYTTKAFNQQVKNNAQRFPSDFMIELTMEEAQLCSRSKNLTLNGGKGQGKISNINLKPLLNREYTC